MSILYLVTASPPAFEGTDAVLREVGALRDAFHGEVVNLSPLKSSTRRFPKQLYGLHKIREIKDLEARCKINHLFFSLPYPFPILRLLRNPTFFTITGSLDPQKKPFARTLLRGLRRIIVSNDRDVGILKLWGLTNYANVPPGLDTSAIMRAALPLGRELTLLMASAPWNMRQFDTKGIDLLLATVANLPCLRLILLWRGVLVGELLARVERLGIGHRVEIVNRKVNVNDYLARAHASIVLTRNGGLVRSFPHSLIECLMAGKPVLLSDTIAMSEYVSSHRCGVVLHHMSIAALSCAIQALMLGYQELARNASTIGRGVFSTGEMVERHRSLYGLMQPAGER